MNHRVFKVLDTNGSAFHGGTGKWDLPKNDTPGKWKTVRGKIEPCSNGLHLCYAKDLLAWIGPAVFEAEYEGELVNAGDKIVVRKARLVKQLNWDDRVARLFACDCAERALKRERKNGREPDPRSWAAVFGPQRGAAETRWQTKRLLEYLDGKRN